MTAEPLARRRLEAAKSSGGYSLDFLYERIERLVAEENPQGDWLDFGAGVGHLIEKLSARAWFRSITGADLLPPPQALPSAARWIQTDLNEPLPRPDHSFSTITAVEIIEHLENPRAMVREAFRLLRPGGTFILTTPNNESWRALGSLVLQGHFVYFTDSNYPAHVTALLAKDLERILGEAGFQSVRLFYTDRGGLPKFPRWEWQQIGHWLKGRRFSDHMIAVASKS